MNQYYIPANFTDAGRLFGIFEIRNGIEAAVIALPLLFICLSVLPFTLTTNLIITMIIVIPAGGFALIGINDDCLTRFLHIWFVWKKKRGVIFHRGVERMKKRKVKQFYGYERVVVRQKNYYR